MQVQQETIQAPPRRTPFIDVLNRAIGLGQKVGAVANPRLEKAALMDAAAARTGLSDFGDPWFEQPFSVLLDSLREEAHLNTAGELAARLQFGKVLRDRLTAMEWFRRHPEILERRIMRPVVIVGPMRSGTTRLHRLLASDHRFSHMRSFETISPVPRLDFEEVLVGRKRDFRPTLAKRVMRVARLANPRTLSIHPTGPFEAEEELGLLVNSMYGMKHEAQWRVPTYGRWCERIDATPAYRHLADLLRLVGWSQQASELKPWVLKTPQHALDLPALLNVFPDARIIYTHRDPRKVVGSAASLAWNQTAIHSDDVTPHDVGQEWLRKSALQLERMTAARALVPAERRIDVGFDEMDRDWEGTMRRIYGFLDLDLAPALPAMRHYQVRACRVAREPHSYSLSQFGLSESEVRARFAAYTARFDVAEGDLGVSSVAGRVSSIAAR
ncbi:sulfotransferase [Citromicrobium bathyomarinum]|uniref:sulfotransferase family protein n=1 Tax=Citromicrobium bathyomarinum TaxID=72174 RepID=UPI00315A9C01